MHEDNSKYAKYANRKSAVLDYYIWQIEYANKLSKDKYYKVIESKYAVNIAYIDSLKSLTKYADAIIKSTKELRNE
jgi:hypothetical protein